MWVRGPSEKLDAEALILASITLKYPAHRLIKEERYSEGSSREYLIKDEEPARVVDPLDGTVNFTHTFPTFCVSIALVHRGKSSIGLINSPLINQLCSIAEVEEPG
jgi:myo-inositol-1(or 4)-monophosphatase